MAKLFVLVCVTWYNPRALDEACLTYFNITALGNVCWVMYVQGRGREGSHGERWGWQGGRGSQEKEEEEEGQLERRGPHL